MGVMTKGNVVIETDRPKLGSISMYVDGKVVSHNDDIHHFKKAIKPYEPLDGKRILMGGLGLGNDAIYCLDRGAYVTVIELVPDVVELFVYSHPRLRVMVGDFFALEANPDDWDLIINSVDSYDIREV